jgi:multiple sugar transport system ATP-binding protein
MNDLEIQQLVKHYGDNAVLDNISFNVSEGEFFVLLGPSGGGKSTMLRVLCGLEPPDTGKIVLGGRDITRLPSRERNVGMVFQDYGLYPHMNTFQNIAYGLEARGVSRDEVTQRVTKSAEKLGITSLLSMIIVDLSGGEQQRVALARALAKDADFYLFDEPLSNLDPKLRASARRDIIMLHREKHKPSIYVTHDQTEAMAIGDRIGVIAGGKMQQVGTADELINKPASLFVAQFIGTPPMNLITTTIHREGTDLHYQAQAENLSFKLPMTWNKALETYGKDQVIVGLRPSAVALEGQPSTFAVLPENTLNGEVLDVEPLIGEVVVTVKLSDATKFSAVFNEVDEGLAPGQSLKFAFDINQIRLFNPTIEQALDDTL